MSTKGALVVGKGERCTMWMSAQLLGGNPLHGVGLNVGDYEQGVISESVLVHC